MALTVLRTITSEIEEGRINEVRMTCETYLLPHFPQALHTIEQVAAPQQLATNERTYEVDLLKIDRRNNESELHVTVQFPCSE